MTSKLIKRNTEFFTKSKTACIQTHIYILHGAT
jgi:hypothetical protein